MKPWDDDDVLCGAPGALGGHTCSGRAGHPGLHGFGQERWDDKRAEQAARRANGEPEPDAEAGSTGTVHQKLGPGVALWHGRITLTEVGVHVDLLVVEANVAAVLVPWRQVRHVAYDAP